MDSNVCSWVCSFCDCVSYSNHSKGRFAWYKYILLVDPNGAVVQFYPYTTPISVTGKELVSVNTVHSIMAHMASAVCLTCVYLRNVPECAKLNPTITRYGAIISGANSRSGYELPRLNERLVYLLFFSVFASTAFSLFQRTMHRTLLPYKSLSVRYPHNCKLIAS